MSSGERQKRLRKARKQALWEKVQLHFVPLRYETEGSKWLLGSKGILKMQRSSPTSVAAAEAILPVAAEQRQRVYNALCEAGPHGRTDAELQRLLGLPGSSERPRRIELVEMGLVFDSGETRPTESGRAACVWRAKLRSPKGLDEPEKQAEDARGELRKEPFVSLRDN